VTEKEALQQAADEARKAARAGREFAGLLDDYAKYLTQPNWHQRADDSYRLALNKLIVIKEGLAACQKLTEESAEAVAADSLKREELKQIALQQESEATAKQDIPERAKPRSIRVEKKAVGT
jgi:phytoene dehydrogenase-like protein